MKKNSEYEKIPKKFQQFGFTEKELNELNKLKWIVTEKVHGANFSFVYENKKLFFAKRKEYLTWNDDFFGFQNVVSEIEDNILALFEQLKLDIKADKYVMYGELFGGKYPHQKVEIYPEIEAIQTGVYYSPTINFCAFDIAFEIDEKKYYLDYKNAVSYFEKYKIFHAKILFSGKLNDAINFDININSKIPSQLQLPDLENNMIEGIVIKPFTHSELKNVSQRPIIKIKNAAFDEEDKFHQAEKWSFIPKITSNSEELSFLVAEITHYINKNRLDSAVSKIGKFDVDDAIKLQKIEQEILEDVWNDFNFNHQNLLNELNEIQKNWLTQRIKALIKGFISNA